MPHDMSEPCGCLSCRRAPEAARGGGSSQAFASARSVTERTLSGPPPRESTSSQTLRGARGLGIRAEEGKRSRDRIDIEPAPRKPDSMTLMKAS